MFVDRDRATSDAVQLGKPVGGASRHLPTHPTRGTPATGHAPVRSLRPQIVSVSQSQDAVVSVSASQESSPSVTARCVSVRFVTITVKPNSDVTPGPVTSDWEKAYWKPMNFAVLHNRLSRGVGRRSVTMSSIANRRDQSNSLHATHIATKKPSRHSSL